MVENKEAVCIRIKGWKEENITTRYYNVVRPLTEAHYHLACYGWL